MAADPHGTPPVAVDQPTCVACGGPLRSHELAWGAKVLACAHCRALFAPEHVVLPEEDVVGLGLPEGLALRHGPQGLRLTWSWRHRPLKLVYLAAPFVVAALTVALSLVAGSWGLILFLLVFSPFLLFAIYAGQVMLRNRTMLLLDRKWLQSAHGPLYWVRNRQVRADDVRWLRTRRVDSRVHQDDELHVIRKEADRRLLPLPCGRQRRRAQTARGTSGSSVPPRLLSPWRGSSSGHRNASTMTSRDRLPFPRECARALVPTSVMSRTASVQS